MMPSINFDGKIFAADTETRTMRGLILPFGAVGNTSAGAVEFHPEAFGQIKAEEIILNREHSRIDPLGRGIAGSEKVTPAGIEMAFKIAPTTAGTDALIEAEEGLRPAFSIEASADEYTIEKGVMKVSRATLTGVAHVTNPAFKAAQITEVAASEEEQTPEAEEAAEELTEETTVEENKETAVAEEVVAEAAPVQASAPMAYTKPRSPIVNGASYLEHSIKAAAGNEDSRIYVRAADDSTSTNTGLTLPSHMQEFVTNTISDRPAIDAVSRQALVSTGMSFTVPKLGDAPTVAATSEGSSPSETGMTSDYLTGTVVKYAGRNDVSWELIDRSSPEFYAELMVQMQNAYAKATDDAVLDALVAGGTAASTQAGTAAGFIAFAGKESAAAFAGAKKKARNVVINTDWWGTLLGAVDSTGRPLFTASNAQNNPGVQSAGSIEGNIMGLNTYVDPYVAASGLVDDSAFIIAPEAVTWYESPTTRLQVQLIETGQVRIGLYGYGCALVKQGDGVRRFNLT
jgi:HK97 family phage major capsid protein